MIYKVSILKKPKTDKSKLSLVLDVYPPIFDETKGKEVRKRKSLKKWIYVSPKGSKQKDHNKGELDFAELLRRKYEDELNKPEIYNELEKDKLEHTKKGQQSFNLYFKAMQRGRSKTDYEKWVAAYNHFENFAGEGVLFNQINKPFCEAYKKYLLTTTKTRNKKPLNQNSAASYFNKFKYSLKQAFEEGILDIDYGRRTKAIQEITTEREYLTEEEVEKLIKTDCESPVFKRAALFSIYSGLRHIHITKLKWKDIHLDHEKEEYTLTYFEEKGKGSNSRGRNEKHYINKYCTTFLGEKGSPNDLVFSGLTKIDKYRVTPNWIKTAGIKKQITFHAFRHTYAMLLLNNGADPYGVSKSMGHKNLKTTEIYVHQLDELKKRTANRVKSKE